MKNAVTAIQGQPSPKLVWTGAELLSRSPRPPVGFYKNTDTSYHGLIFVDQAVNATYFDRTHNMIYSMELEVWKEATFEFQPKIKRFTIELVNQIGGKKPKKKVTKKVDGDAQ
jgi:hypothetical protein